MPLSGAEDSLTDSFPMYKTELDPIRLPPIVEACLGRLSRSKSLNNREDVAFGRARLAVRASDGPDGLGCVYCGRCYSGCVYDSIHNTDQELGVLERTGQVDYRPDRMVTRIDEGEAWVELVCERNDGTSETLRLSRVFVAAGAINSTRLVLESKGLFHRPVPMKSTQGFVVPMLSMVGAPFTWPDANTLTGMFFEFRVPHFPDHWVHTQINAANDLVLARLDYQPQRGRLKDRLLKFGLGRLLVGFCNFHSADAGGYELTLRPGEKGGRSILDIEPRPSAAYERIAKLGAKRLLSLLSKVGVFPLLPLMLGDPKRPASWHFGGTLPMSERPGDEMSTDVLGRPRGWKRVHIVDESVFPSIPSTSVALLSMANAARIAQTADLD